MTKRGGCAARACASEGAMKIEHVANFERTLGRVSLAGWALVLVDAACGGGTPPPATPEPAAQASAAPAGSNEPAVGTATSDETQKSAEPAPAKPPPQDIQLEKPTRPVRSILESADTVYFVSYEE